MDIIKGKIERDIVNKKKKISQQLAREDFSETMHLISKLAFTLYEYNQTYTDDFLERCLEKMVNNISVALDDKGKKSNFTNRKMKILFYDGFGLDTRGLALIYIRALSKIGAELLYITVNSGKGKQPKLLEELKKGKAEIVYLPDEYKVKLYPDICRHIHAFHPEVAFLYTTPWDVPGVMAFMFFSGKMRRYQINLTDHAFWLGIHAFDFCLEFRDFGASVSRKYRKIAKERLLMQPYYPVVEKNEKFGGFPFEKRAGDFIIFSGGSLYKTFDLNHTYYHIVEFCLREVPYTKFWYAGNGDDTYLNDLKRKYPNRVFHTLERGDLFAILLHVDMYLNTIPLGGGLMTQYAAIAGRPPFMLDSVGFSSGFLLNQHSRQIEFYDVDALKTEIRQFIINPEYRKYKEGLLKHAVLSPNEFDKDIKGLVLSNKASHIFNVYDIDTQRLQQVYFERYLKSCRMR